MTLTNDKIASDRESVIDRYQDAIKAIELEAPKLSEAQALKALLARDEVEELLGDKNQISEQQLIVLRELDERLQKQGQAIASAVDLAKMRETLKSPESSWWWFFKSPKEIKPWERLDWVWNLLAGGALALAGSYAFITLQAFSIGGLGVAEAFGTIAQATGIALLGKGALSSSREKKEIRNWLEKFNIPSKFYSEINCGLSMLLLLAIYSIHQSLPGILLKDGLQKYKEGRLSEAKHKLLEAIQLNPQNSELYLPLGAIYETIGDFDNALAQYQNPVVNGNPKGYYGMGRVYISRLNPLTGRPDYDLAEAHLLNGLQRIENLKKPVEIQHMEYRFRRSLGWALLAQKKYALAETELKAAIAIEAGLSEPIGPGGGMGFCFLAETFAEQGKLNKAEKNWLQCLDKARPETMSEYKWLIEVGQWQIASCVDTRHMNIKLDRELSLDRTCDREKVIQSIKATAVDSHKVPEINAPVQVGALRDNLDNEINALWDAGLPQRNAVYQVSVDKDGKLYSYKPVDSLAEEFAINTGLEELVDDNAGGQAAKFEVVFTPQGELDVRTLE